MAPGAISGFTRSSSLNRGGGGVHTFISPATQLRWNTIQSNAWRYKQGSQQPIRNRSKALFKRIQHPSVFRSSRCWCACLVLAVFFRQFLESHFNLIAGNVGDNRFIIAILEHWGAAVQAQAPVTSPNFFWPEHGVIGYSESLFWLSLPYLAGRSVGLDDYLAFEMALIVFKAVGFSRCCGSSDR